MQNVTYIQKSLLAYNGIGLAEDSALRRELYLRWPDCIRTTGRSGEALFYIQT